MCNIIVVAFVLIKVEENICTRTNSNVNLYLVISEKSGTGVSMKHWKLKCIAFSKILMKISNLCRITLLQVNSSKKLKIQNLVFFFSLATIVNLDNERKKSFKYYGMVYLYSRKRASNFTDR